MSKFASLRLGKTSVEDIRKLVKLSPGIRKDDVIISVKCTQVPQEFEVGTYVFIWLGSDNNKGIPTEWKQGYQAIGKLQHINRGENSMMKAQATYQLSTFLKIHSIAWIY